MSNFPSNRYSIFSFQKLIVLIIQLYFRSNIQFQLEQRLVAIFFRIIPWNSGNLEIVPYCIIILLEIQFTKGISSRLEVNRFRLTYQELLGVTVCSSNNGPALCNTYKLINSLWVYCKNFCRITREDPETRWNLQWIIQFLCHNFVKMFLGNCEVLMPTSFHCFVS